MCPLVSYNGTGLPRGVGDQKFLVLPIPGFWEVGFFMCFSKRFVKWQFCTIKMGKLPMNSWYCLRQYISKGLTKDIISWVPQAAWFLKISQTNSTNPGKCLFGNIALLQESIMSQFCEDHVANLRKYRFCISRLSENYKMLYSRYMHFAVLRKYIYIYILYIYINIKVISEFLTCRFQIYNISWTTSQKLQHSSHPVFF